jgi:hypothetical protein
LKRQIFRPTCIRGAILAVVTHETPEKRSSAAPPQNPVN